MINEKNIEKTKQKIQKDNKEGLKPVIVLAQNEEYNRKLIESGKFEIIASIEKTSERNRIRQINSGMNPYLAKTCTKNNISLGIDLDEVRKLPKKEKAERISKIIQNIKICKKNKTLITFLKKEEKVTSRNLLLSLGASTDQAKKSIRFFN